MAMGREASRRHLHEKESGKPSGVRRGGITFDLLQIGSILLGRRNFASKRGSKSSQSRWDARCMMETAVALTDC